MKMLICLNILKYNLHSAFILMCIYIYSKWIAIIKYGALSYNFFLQI